MWPSQCSYHGGRVCSISPPLFVIYPLNILYKVYVIILSHHPRVRLGSVGTWHSPIPADCLAPVSTFYFVSDSGRVSQEGEY